MHIIANAPVECPNCKEEVPDTSQFCPQCAHPLTENAQALVRSKTPRWAAILLVLFLGLVVYVIAHLYNDARNAPKPIVGAILPAAPQTAPPPPRPQSNTHSIPVTNGALIVNAGSFSWYPFTVPLGASTPAVNGHFTAAGGSANDIQVYILDEDSFVNFKNGHATRTFYNSGKVTQAAIAAALPNSSATYYLVFDNRFSPETPRAIQTTATLTYKQ